jgi:NitT/TauT family transport system permease protein
MKSYIRIIGPLALIVLWTFVSIGGMVSPLILPSPWHVGRALIQILIINRDILPDLGFTFYRALLSFLISCLIGIPIGLAMGFMPKIYKSLEFLVDFFRSIPPIALFPLFLLVLGIGEASKLGVPIYGCTLIIIVNSVYGVLNVANLRRLVGTVYGFSTWQIFYKIALPDSLPQVFVGMRTAVSFSLVLTVVVEMFFGSETGMGKKIYDYHLLFDTSEMYASIIVIGLLGYLMNKGFILLEKKFIHWADK